MKKGSSWEPIEGSEDAYLIQRKRGYVRGDDPMTKYRFRCKSRRIPLIRLKGYLSENYLFDVNPEESEVDPLAFKFEKAVGADHTFHNVTVYISLQNIRWADFFGISHG